MDKDEVLKLARLARIEISEEEAENLTPELAGILKYVGEVKDAGVAPKASTKEDFPLRNVMREDSGAHESGIYTKEILKEAPQTEGDYIKVKKIL